MKPLRLVMIYGSVREGRLCDAIADWVRSQIEVRDEFELEVVDPATTWPNIDQHAFRNTIDRADAVLILTPEYNHSYPGPLKTLIDSVSAEWNAKPVAFVSYGGVSGGLRAVEHLRAVFAELHAMTIRDSVSFANAWESFRASGKPADEVRSARTMQTVLDRLSWWGTALRSAREAQVYGEAA